MDSRMRRYAPQSSPERTKVWTEPPLKHQLQQQQQQQKMGRRVPVVYYLCRNRHLEHPHFIEVPLSSPDGLYLRDVIDRLNVLRGKKMAAMYSWSCKRSYKNGFVWHDLSEDDLIIPAQGSEYVLKGSEILDESPPDRADHGVSNAKIQGKNHASQGPPICYKGQEASCLPSSAVVAIKDAKLPPQLLAQSPPPLTRKDDLSPSTHRSGSSGSASPEPGGRTAPLSVASSPKPAGHVTRKPLAAQNASTQTENQGGRNGLNAKIMGVSTNDSPSEIKYNGSQNEQAICLKEEPEIVKVESSPATTSSASSSSGGKMNTLETLIREEISKRNNDRNKVAEEVFLPAASKFKATDVLMNLITCGSIAVKDHGFGSAVTYTPRFTGKKFTSQMLANSNVLGEINRLPESQRQMGLRPRKKECFSGSMIEINKFKEGIGEGIPNLKRSSSFHDDRSYNMPYLKDKDQGDDLDELNCLSRATKAPSYKRFTTSKNSGTSSVSGPRNSAELAICKSLLNPSNDVGTRIADGSTVNGSSKKLESFREVKEKVIKIEERLTSGARIIIESRS